MADFGALEDILINKTILDSGTGNQIGVHVPYTFTIYQDASNYIVRNNWNGVLQKFAKTDFALALEWAINNIVNTGTGTQDVAMGGAIFIQRGVYTATTTLNAEIATSLRHGITVEGEGYGTLIYFNPPIGSPITNGFQVMMMGFKLRNLRIKGNQYVTNLVYHTGPGLGIRRSDHYVYEDIMFEGPNADIGFGGAPTNIAGQKGIFMDGTNIASFFGRIIGCKFLALETGINFLTNFTTSCVTDANVFWACEYGIIHDGAGQHHINNTWIQGHTTAGTTGIWIKGGGKNTIVDNTIAEMKRENPPGTEVACRAILLDTGVQEMYIGAVNNVFEGIHTLSKTVEDNSGNVSNTTPSNINVKEKNFIRFNYAANQTIFHTNRICLFGKEQIYINDDDISANYILKGGNITTAGSKTVTFPDIAANEKFVFEGTSQTLLGKAMSGLSNIFTNIPDSALSANIPLLNAANTFLNAQKISTSASTLLTFYRQVNSLGFGAGFTYNLNDSASAEATYGISYVGIEDNTAGAVRGDFYVQLAIAGVNGIRFRVGTGGDGGILFGNNQRVVMTEGGLTGQRIYTFPDATTKLLGEASPVIQNPITKRTGTYTPTTPTTASATSIGEIRGMLSQHVPTGPGTNTNSFDTTEGLLTNLATTTTQNQNAGLVSPTGALGVGRRLFGMKAILRSKVDTVAGSVSRLYYGFTSATAIPATDTPIANADSGIIVGFNSTDTNYQIRHNDGTGAATVTAITGPIAKNTSFHTIQIEWAASGNIIVTFDGTAQTISTDLPLTTADLKFHCVAQNATAAIRTHSIKGVWLEADK